MDSLNRSYEKMYAAYCRIFDRCGLHYLPVEAESGPIGGDASHEFMIPAANGEDTVLHCKDCGYAANLEKAEIGPRGGQVSDAPLEPVQTVPTPGAATIEQVCRFLQRIPEELIKTLIYMADERPIAVLIRGDGEANENKIRRAAGAAKVALADAAVIQQVTGAPVGFAGPVGMKEPIPIYADRDVAVPPQRRGRGQPGGDPRDGRQPGPRLPAAGLLRSPQRGGRRSLPAVQRASSPCAMRSRWATSSSWGPSIPRPSPPASWTTRSSSARSSWAATGSASTASSPA